MIPIYSIVLSVIEKVLWDFVEEYWRIKKSLQNMEGQKRNTAQLVRIRATVDQRWGLKEDL